MIRSYIINILIWTSNYLERIALSNLTYMMNIVDSMSITVETLSIDSGCSLEKDFIELISRNPQIILYLKSIRLIHIMVVFLGL